jgi:Cys-tRNA(Pro)/Cys-tRNA(Cys) deacylase
VPFIAHELPTEKLGAVEAAVLLRIEPDRVFKTIVVTRIDSKKHILAIVPGPSQVDLKAVARLLDEKKVRLPTEREAEQITGLEAGGISPLALLHRRFTMVLDTAAMNHAQVVISGGQRGLDVELTPNALIELSSAIVGSISRPKERG